MVDFIVSTLQRSPELAIFASLAIGYWIGVIKLGSFSLGTVTGTLLVAILIGQLGIVVSPNVKSIFFIMFLFAVGYGVGPQFIRGIATDGLPQAIFAVVVSVLCLLSVYVACKIAGYDAGLRRRPSGRCADDLCGHGSGHRRIRGAGLDARKNEGTGRPHAGAYAITYIWGTIGTGVILSILGPKLLGVNLEAECKRYEKEMSVGAPAGGMQSAYRRTDIRAYKIGDRMPRGMTVAGAEAHHGDARIFVQRLRRDGKIMEFTPTTALQQGDVIAVAGRTETLVEVLGKYGNEVSDPDLLDMPAEAVDVVLTNKAYDGKTLLELMKTDFAKGVYLNKITRGATSVNIPILAGTKVNRGDILHIAGPGAAVAEAVKNLGYADRPTNATDMVFVGLGILIGGLIGAIVVPSKAFRSRSRHPAAH